MFAWRFAGGHRGRYASSRDGVGGSCGRSSGSSRRSAASKERYWQGAGSALQQEA